MKSLKKLYNTALTQCYETGIPVSNRIVSVTVNRRVVRRWGQCSYNPITNSYTIEINARLLTDDVPDKSTLNTIVHELIHTCDGCMNHGTLWKYYANKMNQKYGYHVQRTNSSTSLNAEPAPANYIVTCTNCGAEYRYMRKGKVVKLLEQRGENSGCRCGVCRSNKLIIK